MNKPLRILALASLALTLGLAGCKTQEVKNRAAVERFKQATSGQWQSANGAAPGQFPEEAGTRGYHNLISSFPSMTVYHDEQSISTYGYTGPGGQWWSFDDAWSIGKKAEWVRSKGLLGAMVWEMSGDTPSGTLMNALHTGLP